MVCLHLVCATSALISSVITAHFAASLSAFGLFATTMTYKGKPYFVSRVFALAVIAKQYTFYLYRMCVLLACMTSAFIKSAGYSLFLHIFVRAFCRVLSRI